MNMSFEVTESCFSRALPGTGIDTAVRAVKAQQASHIGGLVWQPRVTLVHFLIYFQNV